MVHENAPRTSRADGILAWYRRAYSGWENLASPAGRTYRAAKKLVAAAVWPGRNAAKICAGILGVALLGGCSALDRDLQIFVAGDIKNAEAIAKAADNTILVDCLVQLEPVAMASPVPTQDGLLVGAVRTVVLQSAVSGKCGPVLAPMLLRMQGKLVPAPFGVLLPF